MNDGVDLGRIEAHNQPIRVCCLSRWRDLAILPVRATALLIVVTEVLGTAVAIDYEATSTSAPTRKQ